MQRGVPLSIRESRSESGILGFTIHDFVLHMACVVERPTLGITTTGESGRDPKSPEDLDDVFMGLEIKNYI